MAKVELIEFTGKGRPDEQRHAANLLVFTKSTRLNMSPGLLEAIQAYTDTEILEELEYMAGTIPSSWEFIDVTFLVSFLTTPSAQQVTRTRTASFAMQSQRVVDASELPVVNPYDEGSEAWIIFDDAAKYAKSAYVKLSEKPQGKQDARGVLPRNVVTTVACKYNLRSFVDLIRARSSLRVQGEYSDVADQMKEQVLQVWPWAAAFFRSPNDRAIEMLERVANELGVETGKGPAWEIAKAIDLLRK